jgi:hypothetical protein
MHEPRWPQGRRGLVCLQASAPLQIAADFAILIRQLRLHPAAPRMAQRLLVLVGRPCRWCHRDRRRTARLRARRDRSARYSAPHPAFCVSISNSRSILRSGKTSVLSTKRGAPRIIGAIISSISLDDAEIQDFRSKYGEHEGVPQSRLSRGRILRAVQTPGRERSGRGDQAPRLKSAGLAPSSAGRARIS